MKLLLLAGTAEARALAAALADDARFDVTASLADVTRAPKPYAVALRRGGFGGARGLAKYIQDNKIEVIVDATHPFARVMPTRAHAVSTRLGIPVVRLLRPGWQSGPGDVWTYVGDEAAAADVIAKGARVFLATGRRSLPRFGALAEGRHVIARVIDPPLDPFPFPQGKWVVGRPPFTVAAEIETFRTHRIDVLVAKDAGGPTAAKLVAARKLGVPVVLLRRPPPPPGARVENVEAAMTWLERLV